jgi:hypothetical protein
MTQHVALFGPIEMRAQAEVPSNLLRLQGTFLGQLATRTGVIFLPGSSRRALSPVRATDLSDGLFSLVLPCSFPPPPAHHFGYSLLLLYPCTEAASAAATLPDVFSTSSSPNWRAFRLSALICFSFIRATYSC